MKKRLNFFFYYLKEIKYRLILSTISLFFTFFITYIYNFEFLYLIIQPFSRIFIFTEMSEMVQITLKISFWLSLLLSLPHIVYGYFCFISPSVLKNRQKRYFRQLILISLFLYAQTVVAFISIPSIFQFFSGFEIKSFIYTIAWEIRIDSYFRFLSYYLLLFYLLSLLFYLIYKFLLPFPKIKEGLHQINQQNSRDFFRNSLATEKLGYYILKKKNKKKFLFFFILLGSSISPSDLFTQLFITSLFYFSFEIYFFVIYLFHKYKQFLNE